PCRRFPLERAARHRAALLVLPLRAFHHSTNIGPGIDPINELEVGEDLCSSSVTKAFLCRLPPSRFRPGPISRSPAVPFTRTPGLIRCCAAPKARGSRAIIFPAPILARPLPPP